MSGKPVLCIEIQLKNGDFKSVYSRSDQVTLGFTPIEEIRKISVRIEK